MIEPTREQMKVAGSLRRKAMSGWYLGTEETLVAYAGHADVESVVTPELYVRLLFSRDKMHHSVGWWRNAEYEYCYHLSMSAVDSATVKAGKPPTGYEEIPEEDVKLWATLLFGERDVAKAWHEPGGTDPRLTKQEAIERSKLLHLRVFLHPEILGADGDPFVPFIPKGEVYELTRWIPGLTPEKVDR